MGVHTERIQIYYRGGDDQVVDQRSHAHTDCDEFFIVHSGAIVFDVEGEERSVGAREFCHFPVGVYHKIVRVTSPLEAWVIRAPSIEDKVYDCSSDSA